MTAERNMQENQVFQFVRFEAVRFCIRMCQLTEKTFTPFLKWLVDTGLLFAYSNVHLKFIRIMGKTKLVNSLYQRMSVSQPRRWNRARVCLADASSGTQCFGTVWVHPVFGCNGCPTLADVVHPRHSAASSIVERLPMTDEAPTSAAATTRCTSRMMMTTTIQTFVVSSVCYPSPSFSPTLMAEKERGWPTIEERASRCK